MSKNTTARNLAARKAAKKITDRIPRPKKK
ncbi:phosphatidylcholine/phosphatidylserine synthase, partial [Mesorhizobium sp. M7A.F.Ca.US.014.04.1.1]